jgi:site-specific recombinase XerD
MTSDPSRVRVSGPLAGHAAGFGDELVKRGYPPERAARHVGLLAGLSRWLDQQGLGADEVTEGRVGQFLELRRSEGYAEVPSQTWAMTLLGWVPGLAVAAAPAPTATPVEEMVEEYRRYLVHDRGLAPATVRAYVGVARAFLSGLAGCGVLDVGALTAGDVRSYVVRECGQRRVASAQVLVTGLRSLLRFLSVKGFTPHPLAAAVPAASGMRGGALPRALRPDVVAALLASCDSSTLAGRRAFAILTVLSRLGLRAGEVAGLDLDDIDWHRGELAVRGKGGRWDSLPLPIDVGEALVAYLAGDRPHVSCRSVFLRVHAPITGISSSSVSEVVRGASRRAGMPVVSAHRLRHSAATALLQSGGSLAEVGQILRHSRAATTAMYAKVDRAALRALAQPWPGAVA